MITLKEPSGFFLLLALLFLATVHSQCPCPNQTSCQLVDSAQAIIQARILSQTTQIDSVTFTASIKKGLKGNFSSGQLVTFSADPNCVRLKNGKTYVLGLVVRGNGWWHDSCAIRSPRTLISKDLWKTIVKYPKKCPSTPVCLDQSGNTHRNGSSWNVGPCQTCTCVNGNPICVSLTCPPVPCANSYVPAGQCCPVCPQQVGSCIFEGNTYLHDQYWNPDPCRRCHCSNGRTTCILPVCAEVRCNNSYVPVGECCPICPQPTGHCVSGITTYNHGESWYQSACRRCNCNNGVTSCSDIHCGPTNCSNAYVPTGECCPVCPHERGECAYEGTIYQSGQTWNPSSCRRCRCDAGVTTCQTTQCPPLSCSNSYVPAGQCCPICPQSVGQCEYEGEIYNNGQVWNPSNCKNCRCNDGVTTCVTLQCGPVHCNNSYVPEGGCCPICPATNCYDQEGNTIEDGHTWKPLDCMECSCSNAVLRCTSYNCVLPDCPDWHIPTGECCPVCRSTDAA